MRRLGRIVNRPLADARTSFKESEGPDDPGAL